MGPWDIGLTLPFPKFPGWAWEPLSSTRCLTLRVLQSWAEITSQTEGLSRLLRQHAEDLNSGPLNKLSLLIRERQQLRKTYSEQWQQLQQELTKVGGEPGHFYLHLKPQRAGFAQEPLNLQGSESTDHRPAPGACSSSTTASFPSLPTWADLQQGFSTNFLSPYCVPGQSAWRMRMSSPAIACGEQDL